MTQQEEPLVEARLAALRGRLLEWLVGAVYPLWARQGIDPQNGGFVETLGQDALPRPGARRVRVHSLRGHRCLPKPLGPPARRTACR
jgi:hypothetical protein